MCDFLSALVMPSGDVRCEPMLDHHSHLVRYFGIRDDQQNLVVQRFAKVELLPNGHWLDPAKWKFNLDEQSEPDWWRGVADKAESRLRDIAAELIITDKRDIVVGGAWIIGKGGGLQKLVGGRLVAAPDADLRSASKRYFPNALALADGSLNGNAQ